MSSTVFDVLRALKSTSSLKVSGRHFQESFVSRIIKASREKDLIAMVESLAASMNSSVSFVGGAKMAAYLSIADDPLGAAILKWIRENPRVVSMICLAKEEDYQKILVSLPIVKIDSVDFDAIPAGCIPSYQIPVTANLSSPLSHGDDVKAGNSMLFRRRRVLGKEGVSLDLPYYAGNAIRGQMRDLLADHFLSTLGLSTSRAEPSVALWFFHAIYAGGVLQEGGNDVKAINKALGNHGTANADGIRRFRDMLPALSLLGSAMGNKVIAGRLQVGDLRPECIEWATGKLHAYELLDWVFITRKDNHEGNKDEDEQSVQMIANTEVLKDGVVMNGGIDYDGHIQDLELSALGMGLELLKVKGKLGGKSREGLGKCNIFFENQPDPMPYIDYLNENKAGILDYLKEIGAIL